MRLYGVDWSWGAQDALRASLGAEAKRAFEGARNDGFTSCRHGQLRRADALGSRGKYRERHWLSELPEVVCGSPRASFEAARYLLPFPPRPSSGRLRTVRQLRLDGRSCAGLRFLGRTNCAVGSDIRSLPPRNRSLASSPTSALQLLSDGIKGYVAPSRHQVPVMPRNAA